MKNLGRKKWPTLDLENCRYFTFEYRTPPLTAHLIRAESMPPTVRTHEQTVFSRRKSSHCSAAPVCHQGHAPSVWLLFKTPPVRISEQTVLSLCLRLHLEHLLLP